MDWFSKSGMAMTPLTISPASWLTQGEELEAIFEVNGNSQVFVGHFPGSPILPGVCLIDAALQLVPKQFKDGGHVAVRSMRLTKPIIPGVSGKFKLCRVEGVSSKWKCLVEIGGVVATRFELDFDAVFNPAKPLAMQSSPDSTLNSAISKLPHRPPMHLIDSACKSNSKSVVTYYFVDSANPWMQGQDSVIPGSMIIESFLQSSALVIHEALVDGWLTVFGGARKVQLTEAVPSGSTLEHRITPKLKLENTTIIDGQTLVDGRVVAEYTGIALAIRTQDQIMQNFAEETV